MAKYLSAKEFRQQMPQIAEDLARYGEIVVVKRSKPLFKVVSFEESPADLLDRSSALDDPGHPSLSEMSSVVHEIKKG